MYGWQIGVVIYMTLKVLLGTMLHGEQIEVDGYAVIFDELILLFLLLNGGFFW